MSLVRYLSRRMLWYIGALFVAVLINFLLPRLIPGNPVDAIASQMGRGGVSGEQMQATYAYYTHAFGLDKPLWEQFLLYLKHVGTGDFGSSLALYPASVNSLLRQALPWTIALQLPAILIGWIVGNVLGAIAAYRGGWFDRGAFLGSLFTSSVPYYCLAILLLYLLAVVFPILPPSGGLSAGNVPELTPAFFADALSHYWLPFLSLVVVFIGGQAVGMRSMAIYELGSDYVNYSRGLGLRDRTIVRYIFRNASLPQVSGLALSIGGMVGGALLTELVFSYPGIGTLLFSSINQSDYTTLFAITLIITVALLIANFCVDIANGVIDPRIRAASAGER
jgi:peptide/nickel transport system permease protein